jgi:hypothetical protein
MKIYQLLGVSDSVISLWRYMHQNWRYKGLNFRGQLDAMRLTG